MAIDITPRDPWGSLFKFAALEQQAAELSFAKKQWMANIARETDDPEMYYRATGKMIPSQVNPFYNESAANLQNKTVDKNAIVSSNMGALANAADNYYRETPKAKGQKQFITTDKNGKERIETEYEGNGLAVNPNESNMDLMAKVARLTGMKPGDAGWDQAVSFVANKQKWATEKMVKDTESTISKEQAAADQYNKQIEGEKKFRGNRYLSNKGGGSAGYGVDANSIIESFNYMVQNHARSPQDVMKFYNMATEGLKSSGVTWKRPEDNPLGAPSRYMNFGGTGGGDREYTATLAGDDAASFTFTSKYASGSPEFIKEMNEAAKRFYPGRKISIKGVGPAGRTQGDPLTQAKVSEQVKKNLEKYSSEIDGKANKTFQTEAGAKAAAAAYQSSLPDGYVVIQDPVSKKYTVQYTGTYESPVEENESASNDKKKK